MSRTRRSLAVACALSLLTSLLTVIAPVTPVRAAEPIRVIFDTDIEDDVDDAGAVAALHALADNGEADILAMMVNTNSQWGAPALDAFNTRYGRPAIPIGTLKPTTDGTSSRYTRQVAEEFPNDLRTGHNAPDATTLYRQILAGQPDGSVTIISVGFLTNLANLLASGPDATSPLSGRDLLTRKVRLLSAMAGAFPSGSEFNLNQRPAAATALNTWPTRAVFSGYEIGDSVYTGARLFTQTPANNPVQRAYGLYSGYGNNRPSWDQTSVYYAVRGTAGLFGEAGHTGSISVNPDGSNTWNTAVDKDQLYLTTIVPDQTVATAIEDLMVQAPRTTDPAGSFVLGVNFNGPAVTVDGNAWRSYSSALSQGLSVPGGANLATNTVVPSPDPGGGTSTMLAGELWRTGDIAIDQTLPNGAYEVYVWVMEDYRAGYRSFEVDLEGATATTVTTGAVGSWQRHGPLPVTVGDGRLDLDLVRVFGDTLIQGLAVHTARPAAPTSMRVNLNGSSTTIDGRTWLSHSDAIAAGLTTGTVNYATNTATPNPATAAGVTTMLRSELWWSGDMRLTVPLPTGDYDVYLWVMEDFRGGYHGFDVDLEGTVAVAVDTGAVGSWQRYGPLRATVSDGRLEVDLRRRYGDTLVQGLAVVPRGETV